MRHDTLIALAAIVSAAACSTAGSNAPSTSTPASSVRFTTGQVIDVPADPTNIAVADFNGDGKPDLAVTSLSDSVVGVLLGRGDGTFASTLTIPAGQVGSFIVAAELDGDGHIDLATSNQDGSTNVLWGKGDGTFGGPLRYKISGALAVANPQGIAAADLNGDGKLDLVVSVYGATDAAPSAPGHVAVLLNQGSRKFANPVFYPDRAAVAVVIGDFNGDGKLDVATADFDSTVRVFRGDGKGGLGPPAEYAISGQGVAIAAGAFKGDGVLDMATGNDASLSMSVLRGVGDGTFRTSEQFGAGNTHMVAIVDLDRDGHADLLTGGYDERFIRYLRGKGDGTFLPEVRIDTSWADVRGFGVADFNGDGKPDIAVTDNGPTLHVFLAS